MHQHAYCLLFRYLISVFCFQQRLYPAVVSVHRKGFKALKSRAIQQVCEHWPSVFIRKSAQPDGGPRLLVHLNLLRMRILEVQVAQKGFLWFFLRSEMKTWQFRWQSEVSKSVDVNLWMVLCISFMQKIILVFRRIRNVSAKVDQEEFSHWSNSGRLP